MTDQKDRPNRITAKEELLGGATDISYQYTKDGELKESAQSFKNNRLYIQEYMWNDEEKKSHRVSAPLWAAFRAGGPSADTAELMSELSDSDKVLAHNLLLAMPRDLVGYDSKAGYLYVKPDQNFEDLMKAGVVIATGKTIVEREVEHLKKRGTEIADLKVEQRDLRDWTTETAMGAVQLTHKAETGQEYTRTFLANRQYLQTKGGVSTLEKLKPLAMDKDVPEVKWDGFAMTAYVPFDLSMTDTQEFLAKNDEWLFATRGDRLGNFLTDRIKESADVELISHKSLTEAGYVSMKEDFIATKEKEAADKLNTESSVEADEPSYADVAQSPHSAQTVKHGR